MGMKFSKDIGLSNCGLCEISADLRQSHIIPSFVFEWLLNTSATGFIRFGEAPNLRVQDGWKPKMLCGDCEQKFALLEKRFAESCFYPIVNGDKSQIHYGTWMLKFATSVSWRVLRSFKAIGGLDGFPQKILDAAEDALSTWKAFLLDEEPHPGRHEQHLILLDGIVSTSLHNVPANVNRYLLRALEIYVAYTPDSAVTYAKMGKFVLFGFIENPYPRRWKGTKINANEGRFGVRDIELPLNVGEFIMDRARLATEKTKQISEKQRIRITETYRKDMDRAANSETIRAMTHDVLLFGDSAFEATQGENEEST